MKIRLNRNRQQGLIFLGIIVIVVALGLGGCAFIEVFKRLEKIDEKKKQQETNCLPEFVFDAVIPPTQDEVQAISPNTQHGAATKIDTNWYNPVLEDETGF